MSLADNSNLNPKVRTLKEPPEIWELVHETRAEFKPGSALVGHLKALHPVGLAVILLTVGGVAVYSFVTLRDRSASPTNAPSAQAPNGNTKTDVSPQSTVPVSTESSAQSTSNAPAVTDPAARTNEGSKIAVGEPASSAKTADLTLDAPKNSVSTPALSSSSQVLTKPRSQSPTMAIGEKVGARNKDRADASSPAKLNTPTTARTDNKDVGKASIAPSPTAGKEQATNPPAAKKEADKAQGPQLIAPAKTGSTPKAKVIAWP